MKRLTYHLCILAVLFFSSDFLFADNENLERSMSPYFEVKSESDAVDILPLLKTSADVKIRGVIADVTVKQIYHNSGVIPLEATYVFPASIHAAVYGMTMQIGNRLIVAEIKEKEEARKVYEKAKAEGKTASLLVQIRPNVFEMNLANILKGDTIIVTLNYTELLIPENGIYEFVYPTVVGPRYTNNSSKDSRNFNEIPYGEEGENPFYDFDLTIDISGGVPLDYVECSTHKMIMNKIFESQVKMKLDSSETTGGNRDFILKYRLSGGIIQTGLLLNEGKDENFFLLMLQPPQKIKEEEIPPREYLFILDVSGSMGGFPISVSKKLIFDLLGNLRETDKFNILLFAGYSFVLFNESKPASSSYINLAKKEIESQFGGGGTELLPALKRALNMPKDDNYSRIIAILTDGYVDIEKEAFEIISDNLSEANLFAFGIGSSVNRLLIESIARAGNGKAFIVTKENEAKSSADNFIKYIGSPVMNKVNIEFKGFNTYDVEPKNIPDVFTERPILIYGKWQYPAEGSITVSGNYTGKRYKVDIPLNQFAEKDSGKALTYLWARNRLSELSDYTSSFEENQNKDIITELGLKYNLLTNFTSFVAVDYEIRNNGQFYASLNQPVPLPQGVSNNAFGNVQSTSSRSSFGSWFSGGGSTSAGGDDPLNPAQRSDKIFFGLTTSYLSYQINKLPLMVNSFVPDFEIDEIEATGFAYGLTYEHHFGKIEEATSSIIFNLTHSLVSGNFKKEFPEYKLILNDTIFPVVAEYSSEFNLDYINLDVMFKQNFLKEIPIGITTGVGLGFLTDGSSIEKFNLISNKQEIKFPVEANPINDGKTLFLNDGTRSNLSHLSLKLLFGLQYEIIIGQGYYITPWYQYRISLLNLINNTSSKYGNYDIGIALRLAF